MKLLCPLNIIRLRKKKKNNENATVNNILNTQGKSHDGLKLCRKLILTSLFWFLRLIQNYIIEPLLTLTYFTCQS